MVPKSQEKLDYYVKVLAMLPNNSIVDEQITSEACSITVCDSAGWRMFQGTIEPLWPGNIKYVNK